MTEKRVTQVPFPGGSGAIPTGAMQFQGDWPGLFIRGDEAMLLKLVIEQMTERLRDHPDVFIGTCLRVLAKYATIIDSDVIVRGDEPLA